MQRCKARSKRSGEQCKNFAIKKFGVCRMHGAYGGPKTREGLIACKQASFQHGCYSKEAIEELRLMRQLARDDEMCIKYDNFSNCIGFHDYL